MLDGLLDEPRPGAPRKHGDAAVERLITKTLESTPRDATHWSTRSMTTSVLCEAAHGAMGRGGARGAFRYYDGPGGRSGDVGFRVVRGVAIR